MLSFTPTDERHMRRALALAARGQGRVEPNPMVGCVIAKRGLIIGEGYHHRFGGPHAEIDALRHCTTSPRGATVYVTLEPCHHHGKTPPCTDALIAAGVRRVIAAIRDPHTPAAGGLAVLRRAGITADVGLLAGDAAALNAPFLKLVTAGRPWVILKWAQSLDGKLATHTGDSKWISDETCRAHAHRVRGRIDAILVGVGTVLADDPLLTCRAGRPRRIARRIILDTHLRTPPDAKLVRTARLTPTLIFHASDASAGRARRLAVAGCELHAVKRARGGGLDLSCMLDMLGALQITNLLVEGGGRVLGSFLDGQLADEVNIYVAPLLLGGVAAPGPWQANGIRRVTEALRFSPRAGFKRLGTGFVLKAQLHSGAC